MLTHLRVTNLLSFGPNGLDLELQPLNVLIGPNGSGKSNLLEVLALLRAMPTNLAAPLRDVGGVREWFYKSPDPAMDATIEVTTTNDRSKQPLRHRLVLIRNGDRIQVGDEVVENERPYAGKSESFFYYRFQHGNPVINETLGAERRLSRASINDLESILQQVRDPDRYPILLSLQSLYESIRLFRNWSFGPNSSLRKEQSTHAPSEFLLEGGDNLAVVLSKIRSRVKPELLDSLRNLNDEFQDFSVEIESGNARVFFEESGGRSIATSRLSDGTLRYLCLLAILIHPSPPRVIAIEEPELGLHPDLIPHIADLLVQASEKTQLVITTHSQMLIDAIASDPSRVVVCSKQDGESHFERLEPDKLQVWLEKYSLGTLWSMGLVGGNRW